MDGISALDPAAQEAIDWEVRLRSGEVSQEERDAFTAWRHADPSHEEAWTRLQQRLGRLSALQGTSGAAVRRALNEPSRGRRRLVKSGAGVAAAVLAGVGARQLISVWSLDADYYNGHATPQRIALDGGIPVTAGAAARVYAGDHAQGDIYLAAGQIATDTGRPGYQPTVVTTRDGMVRTERSRVSVDVLRLHTVVAVEGGDAVLAVHQGHRLRVPDGSVWSLSAGRIERMPETSADIFSWTRGALVVLDRPVPDVVETLGRYFSGYIHFPSVALSRRVSGVFPLSDVEGALQQLAESLGFSLKLYGNVLAVATQV
ncbi:histidine kinase [Burkholderia cepacia]|nr:histidine kinase [Burkholderia cepacia]